jgi:hypothetical protein
MSGRPSIPLHVSIRRARARLALVGLLGWGALAAASFAIHGHDARPATIHAARA